MDDIEKDIFEEYSDQLSELLRHLMENKTLSEDHRSEFMMSMATQIFKVGFALEVGGHPNQFKTHGVTLVPLEFKEEIAEALKKIQDKHLVEALDEQIKNATSNEAREKIYKSFNRAVSGSKVNTDIKAYS